MGNVTINGGTVKAYGANSMPGIGLGATTYTNQIYNDSLIGTVTINGGTVTAASKGDKAGAAIGGSQGTQKSPKVAINGGKLTLTSAQTGVGAVMSATFTTDASAKGLTVADSVLVTNTSTGATGMGSDGAALLTGTEKGVVFTAEVLTHTVTFDTDGGSAVDPITVEHGKNITSPPSMRKTDYTFGGWYYPNGMTKYSTQAITDDLTLKAKWVAFVYLYKYEGYAESDGGGRVEIGGKFTDSGSAPTMPTVDGITATGYYEAGSNTPFDFANTVITQNIKLYARYPKYTVKFAADSDHTWLQTTNRLPSTQTVNTGATATKPDDPQNNAGEEFAGWTLPDGTVYDFSTPVNTFLTLTTSYRTASSSGSGNTGGSTTESKPVTAAEGTVTADGVDADAQNAAKALISAAITNGKKTSVKASDFNASKIDSSATSVSVSIKTTLNSYTLTASDGGAKVSKLVYDVTPYATIDGGTVTAVPNSAINGTPTFTVYLPIPSNFQGSRVNVVHRSSGYSNQTFSNVAIQGSDNARYITVNVSHFSEFDITPATGSGSSTDLPNTDSLDARGVYATILILSAFCAAGTFAVRRRSQRKG